MYLYTAVYYREKVWKMQSVKLINEGWQLTNKNVTNQKYPNDYKGCHNTKSVYDLHLS